MLLEIWTLKSIKTTVPYFQALSEAVQPSSPVSLESPQSKSPPDKQGIQLY